MSAPTNDLHWRAFQSTMNLGWSTKEGFTDEDARAFRRVLGPRFPAEVVVAAVSQLATTSDRTFYPRPSISDVARECNRILHPELAEVPWAEFWPAFNAALKSPDYPRRDTVSGRAAWVGNTIAAELGPVAGAYAASIAGPIQSEPLGDASQYGAIVARYSKDWREFQADMRARGLQGGRVPTPSEVLKRSGREPRMLSAASQGVAHLPGGKRPVAEVGR